MSYDFDGEGNKIFYEEGLGSEELNKLSFDDWVEINYDELVDEYITNHEEEDKDKIKLDHLFYGYCENKYEEYNEK